MDPFPFIKISQYHSSKCSPLPRKYPSGFGRRLVEAYLASNHGPFRADLRRKYLLPQECDVAVFREYPCNLDQWEDAKLGEVFDYIWSHPKLCIPAEWKDAMSAFKTAYDDIRTKAPCFKC